MIDHNAIDRAIDETARAMTAGEPGTALRIHVMARLSQRQVSWRSPWLLSPIVVAAALLVAVMIGRVDQAPTSRIPPPAEPIAQTRTNPPMNEVPQRSPRTSASSGKNTRITAPVQGESGVAAMAPPPLEVPSLALTEIDRAESIRLPELETIAPITIAPIGEPEGERP